MLQIFKTGFDKAVQAVVWFFLEKALIVRSGFRRRRSHSFWDL